MIPDTNIETEFKMLIANGDERIVFSKVNERKPNYRKRVKIEQKHQIARSLKYSHEYEF